ncbi:helix-turn-helix domain-containing protein [Streptomyces lusitanus]|uniref:Helix-turn-helix transcriptional regulator n=1 Tax=Streptomyces lusitanus TaxID=68232 RepID=A0ABU3JIH6_9ACTN|nr:helix-turn-helix transcriptional regulator [Streptomyces lusitanus]
MAVSRNPMFLRQMLRDRLRRARESAALTQQQVADTFGWSPSKVIRIENGKIGVSITDAMALADRYGLAEEERRELVELARAARQPPWFAPYKGVMSPELEAYIAYEESAVVVRAFERNVMPGLLQTEEYARSILQAIDGDSVEMAEMRVELRMRRQQILTSEEARFFFILDEAVLRRAIGGVDVMRQQCETLLRMNELPNVTVYYVPFAAGAYSFFRTPYQVFTFDTGDPVAYLETTEGEVLLHERVPGIDRREPSDYLDAFLSVERGLAQRLTEEVLFGERGVTG